MWVNLYQELVDAPKLREVYMGGGAVLCFCGTEKELLLLTETRFRLDLKKDLLRTKSRWIEQIIHLLA